MANAQTVLKVFISSPSDLGSERESIVAAIEEFNATWASHFGTRLEPLRWETNTRPGVGKYSQDVINEQISNDYDIFVGIMWKRFGTKTRHFGSGTEEEFESAFVRYKKSKDSVRLLTYFKDEPIPVGEIEPKQIQRIIKFKSKLEQRGILYRKYKSLDEFQKLIRMHLSLEVQAWQRQKKRKPAQKAEPEKSNQTSPTALNPADLRKYSDQSVANLRRLMEEHHAALGDYLKDLKPATRKSSNGEDILFAAIKADKALCDRLEPILGEIAAATDTLIQVWIAEFNAAFLNGNTTKGSARDLLRRFRNLSKVLRDQAKRSSFKVPVHEILLTIPRFRVSHIRLDTLFKTVSEELSFTAGMLSDAANSVEQFLKQKRS